MNEKQLSYKGYINILNRVAYKLIKSGKNYKHMNNYTINDVTRTCDQIIATIKKNGTNYKSNEYIGLFVEDIVKQNKDTIMPSYVVGSSKITKYKREYYIDMINRVTKWRTKNGKNPKTVRANYDKIINNCTNPYTSSPHYTEPGCNKLGQCTAYYCGPHSIHQGLRKFGITNISEETLAKWAGTTSAGTGHDGLNTAIAAAAKKSNVNLQVKWYNFSDLGDSITERFKKLALMICKPDVFVFCHIGYRGNGSSASGTIFGHYEMLDMIDIEKQQVRALNSLGSKCSASAYCGHLQWRSYSLQAHYISNISQKSICVVTKI